jgi:hypothetical protein
MTPRSAYDFLPYIYVVLGMGVALLLYNAYAIVSGILLVLVGLGILHMRLRHRTDKMHRFQRLFGREKHKNLS